MQQRMFLSPKYSHSNFSFLIIFTSNYLSDFYNYRLVFLLPNSLCTHAVCTIFHLASFAQHRVLVCLYSICSVLFFIPGQHYIVRRYKIYQLINNSFINVSVDRRFICCFKFLANKNKFINLYIIIVFTFHFFCNRV